MLTIGARVTGLAVLGDNAPPWLQLQNLLGAALLGQFDATAEGSITLVGSSVTSWTDLIQGVTASAGGSSTRPQYAAGRVSFDGIDDYLSAATNPWLNGAAPGEMWVVASQDNPAGTGADASLVFFGSTTTIRNSRALDRTVVAGVNRAQNRTGNNSTGIVAPATDTVFSGSHVARLRWDGSTEYITLNGGSEFSAAVVPATASARFTLGSALAGAVGNAKGWISCVLITAPLTGDQASSLLPMLQEKYL